MNAVFRFCTPAVILSYLRCAQKSNENIRKDDIFKGKTSSEALGFFTVIPYDRK